MVLIRVRVHRLHLLRRAGERLLDIATLVADERLLGIKTAFEEFGDRSARHLRIGAFVPGHRQCLQRAVRLPPRVADDRNGGVADLEHVLDAFHALNLGGIEARELAAEHGAIPDRGAQHSGQLEVQAIDLLAGKFGQGVEPLERFAGDGPILGIFERHILGRLDLGCGFGDLAVGRGAARRLVRDHAFRRAALGGGHLPLIGGRLNQHGASRGAGLAHVVIGLANAAAAGGEIIAPHAIAGETLPRRGKFHRDFVPVTVELLGDELGETGRGALSHLGAGDADHDGVVRADHHPGGHLGRAVRRANDLRSAERNVEPKCQSASGGRGTHHELAAINCRHIRHGCLPPHALAAAAWIAARTCWKVPQRQILVMVVSMSASVGFGLSLSSAATAMIIPHWQ